MSGHGGRISEVVRLSQHCIKRLVVYWRAGMGDVIR